MLQKLPLDINTFRRLRTSEFLYVDKTKYAYDLITGGHRYFLSRPRRFGKSLFVSMLQEVLLGERDLFNGLWIAGSDYSWKKHGVITLDLSALGIKSKETFEEGICQALIEVVSAYKLNITTDFKSPELALRAVVLALYAQYGAVAVLVDEYDNPILNILHDPDKARSIRDALKHFFATIKGLDAYINFVFITGVSSFTRAGLFSGINNLQIITLDDTFSGICGYTELEVSKYFDDYIKLWADKENLAQVALRQQIKQWYNGYHFGKNVPAVYNPFSFMHALRACDFKNFWIQSGTPTFLIEEFKKEYSQQGNIIIDPETLEVTEDILQAFDIGAIPLPALMFQAGYLTITGYNLEYRLFSLGYPNQEVEKAFNGYLLEIFTNLNAFTIQHLATKLRLALKDGAVAEVVSLLKQLFARVTYYEQEDSENYYHTTLQNAFSLGGIDALSQFTTSTGRADIVLTLTNMFYIIEVKVNQSAELALRQIKERRYYEALLSYEKPIVLIGLSFTRKSKTFNITYATETIQPK